MPALSASSNVQSHREPVSMASHARQLEKLASKKGIDSASLLVCGTYTEGVEAGKNLLKWAGDNRVGEHITRPSSSNSAYLRFVIYWNHSITYSSYCRLAIGSSDSSVPCQIGILPILPGRERLASRSGRVKSRPSHSKASSAQNVILCRR